LKFSIRTILRATFTVALLFFQSPSFGNPYNKAFDYTCMWVVRNSILTERNIQDVVDFADENGIKHLFVQVRGRGDALYKSAIVPRSGLLQNDDYDPLQIMIEKAHAKGIKIHAWVNVYVLWSSGQAPYSRDHIFYKKQDWFDQNSKELEPLELLKKYRKGNGKDEGIYLAPHHPEVNQYLLAVFSEVVAKYEIDGLHLDYIRYKDSQYGKM